jgi:hypothetical protein
MLLARLWAENRPFRRTILTLPYASPAPESAVLAEKRPVAMAHGEHLYLTNLQPAPERIFGPERGIKRAPAGWV